MGTVARVALLVALASCGQPPDRLEGSLTGGLPELPAESNGCRNIPPAYAGPETCDGLDNDCDWKIDEDFDADGDEDARGANDCDDSDPSRHPGAEELYDGIDNDCDGIADNSSALYEDDDGDGYSEVQGDCDDTTMAIGPLAVDRADVVPAIDDDCDGVIDEAIPPCPTTRDLDAASSYGHALDLCTGITSVQWAAELEPARDIVADFGDHYLPRRGPDMVVMSTGLAVDRSHPDYDDASTHISSDESPHPEQLPDPADGCGRADPDTVQDYSELVVGLQVPGNAHSLSFDVNFMSIEFPEYVCSSFDDTFLALVDSSLFAGNIARDEQGNRLSINVSYFDVCSEELATQCTGQDELIGTGFETASGEDGGGTGWLTATTPVSPGEKITLRLIIFDESDGILDSMVLLDNLRWGFQPVPAPIMLPL